jgi:ribonuclease Y
VNLDYLVLYLLLFTAGTLVGIVSFWIFHRMKQGSYQRMAGEIIRRGEIDAEKIRRDAEIEYRRKQVDLQREFEEKKLSDRSKLMKEEARLKQREDKLDSRMSLVEKKLSEIEKKETFIADKKEQLDQEKQRVLEKEQKFNQELEKISGLTTTEARALLIDQFTHEVKADAANLIRRMLKEAEEEGEQKATSIIATAINRLAVPCVSETTINTVAIPSDEMKGRIIGREGRNIRTLERETGVNFIIDDTPGAVVLSGFDPVRLYIAKTALTELLADGRIHPTRIEEVVVKARETVKKKIWQYGEDAALRANAMNLHPELITLLGKLKFRFSYGQNVLEHSLEVSHILGMMAAELNLDVALAKRIGLLHDVGKAVTHEVEGSHAVIGYDLALKYGESQKVANGIGCHHREMDPMTVEGSLCGAADAISASRPGARIEALEEYIKRQHKLEEIAMAFPGVDKAYSLQAGRELRLEVLPEMIDDDGALNLARDLSKKIEQEIHYNGKIKVTVIREKRVVEYAL